VTLRLPPISAGAPLILAGAVCCRDCTALAISPDPAPTGSCPGLPTLDLPAVSAHVVVREECFAAGGAPRLLDELQSCLAGHFDVEHSTFQLEALGHVDHEAPQHD